MVNVLAFPERIDREEDGAITRDAVQARLDVIKAKGLPTMEKARSIQEVLINAAAELRDVIEGISRVQASEVIERSRDVLAIVERAQAKLMNQVSKQLGPHAERRSDIEVPIDWERCVISDVSERDMARLRSEKLSEKGLRLVALPLLNWYVVSPEPDSKLAPAIVWDNLRNELKYVAKNNPLANFDFENSTTAEALMSAEDIRLSA